MRKLILSGLFVLFTSAAAPATASADWLFTPFIGANFGGSARFLDQFDDFDDEFERRVDFGASLAWMGGGIAGFELDFGYSPNFFTNTSSDANFEFGDNHVTTLMANIVLGVPAGGQTGKGLRPYVSGGIGRIMSRIDEEDAFGGFDHNDWGFNVGGGVTGFFNDNLGLRGDVRFFRGLGDEEVDDDLDIGMTDFKFWRGTVGLVFRFGGS